VLELALVVVLKLIIGKFKLIKKEKKEKAIKIRRRNINENLIQNIY
jgi:hypothetical protein